MYVCICIYTVQKLIRKYSQKDDYRSNEFVIILNDMRGKDQANIEASSTYMDYVKVWIETNDCGGLTFVSLDALELLKW